jgi:membrane protein DedA with SNARE-associated domain
MSEILDPILTLVLNYGYPIIVGCVIAAYFGVPIPTDAILLAAGSFSTDGALNIFLLIPIVALTAIIGDYFGYYLGKKFGYLVVNKYTKKLGLTQIKLNSVDGFLKKWGIWCVFLTRWLLTPLGIPVNIMAGISKYSLKKFLSVVVIGELIWATIFLYLGYLFGANWVTLLDYIDEAPLLLALAAVGAASIYFGFKIWRSKR